ncbi:hypothetical protein [Sphingomonas sp. 3-13AW]|jgi:hypothetical protein|uniref:hypothetical protein n=1 Tax=Sphingomonas sp. 3-13AW TaxID=3050450 RepID=UPI003BB5900A
MNVFTRERRPPASAGAERFITLLRIYPQVDAGELEEMIHLLPRLPVLDTALLSADPLLSCRLEAFIGDHRRRLRRSRRDQFVFGAATFFLIALVACLVWIMA